MCVKCTLEIAIYKSFQYIFYHCHKYCFGKSFFRNKRIDHVVNERLANNIAISDDILETCFHVSPARIVQMRQEPVRDFPRKLLGRRIYASRFMKVLRFELLLQRV
jgi:hypothetical protein